MINSSQEIHYNTSVSPLFVLRAQQAVEKEMDFSVEYLQKTSDQDTTLLSHQYIVTTQQLNNEKSMHTGFWDNYYGCFINNCYTSWPGQYYH